MFGYERKPGLSRVTFTVGGSTNSGKTVFLSTILLSLLIKHPRGNQLKLLISSTAPEDFLAFDKIPQLLSGRILSDAVEASNYIKNDIFQESEHRQKLFIKEKVQNIQLYNQRMREKGCQELPPIVVLIDEFADLVDYIDDKKDKTAFLTVVRQIAQAGRKRGIHLILCTQRPSAKLLDTNIKAQLPARICLTVTDQNSARMILDDTNADATHLQGKGDLLFKLNDQTLRAQGYGLNLLELENYVKDIVIFE